MDASHQLAGPGVMFSTVSLLIVASLLVSYLAAVRVQRRTGRSWGRGRTVAFLTGLGLLAVALSPALLRLAHHDLRVHTVQHLLIGMFAPLGLVLAAPMTLLLRTLPTPTARRITKALRSRPVRALSHPATALVLNAGGMYLLYLTPLYAATTASPALHHLVLVNFFAAGYLFTWSILAGPDPAPHPPGMWVRLGVLFLSMAAHATLGKLMYGYLWPRGTVHGAGEIRFAAQLMYYGGDLAELLLVVVLFASWYRARGSRPYSLHLFNAE